MLGVGAVSVAITVLATALFAAGEMRLLLLLEDWPAWSATVQRLQSAAGSAALFTAYGVLVVDQWLRQAPPALQKRERRSLQLGAVLLAAGLVAELVGSTGIAGFELRLLGQAADAAALLAIAFPILSGSRIRETFADPAWAWLGLALILTLPMLVDSMRTPWLSRQHYMWLLVGGYPGALAVAWETWAVSAPPAGETAPATGKRPGILASRLTWLGIAPVVMTAPLLLALAFQRTDPHGIQGAYYLVMATLGLNALGLVCVGIFLLARKRIDLPTGALLVAGLILMVLALVPAPQPDWEPYRDLWVNRLGFDNEIGITGLYLTLLAGTVAFLRRNDPRGGPPSALSLLWPFLACSYLLLLWHDSRTSSYALWVGGRPSAEDALGRVRLAYLPLLGFLASLLALVPSVWRVLRDERPDPQT